MKKTTIILAILLTLDIFALKLRIFNATFNTTAVKANSVHSIEVLGDQYGYSSPEVVNIWMARKDSTGAFVDSVFLYKFNIKDLFYPTYRMGKDGYTINLQMPAEYYYGKFYILVDYTDQPQGAFWITQTVGIYDEIVEDKKEGAIYYDINGSLLSSPNGLCIEVIGSNRRKVFIRGN